MASDEDEYDLTAAWERVQREHEAEMFKQFRARGTALMDQYQAHVKNLLRMLHEHRPHCIIYQEHGSEMCPGAALTQRIEEMNVADLQRSLMMAVVLLARQE